MSFLAVAFQANSAHPLSLAPDTGKKAPFPTTNSAGVVKWCSGNYSSMVTVVEETVVYLSSGLLPCLAVLPLPIGSFLVAQELACLVGRLLGVSPASLLCLRGQLWYQHSSTNTILPWNFNTMNTLTVTTPFMPTTAHTLICYHKYMYQKYHFKVYP